MGDSRGLFALEDLLQLVGALDESLEAKGDEGEGEDLAHRHRHPAQLIDQKDRGAIADQFLVRKMITVGVDGRDDGKDERKCAKNQKEQGGLTSLC